MSAVETLRASIVELTAGILEAEAEGKWALADELAVILDQVVDARDALRAQVHSLSEAA